MQLLVIILFFFINGIFFQVQAMTPKQEIFSILEQEENNFFENQLKEAITKNLSIVNETYNNEPALHYALKNGKTNFAKILIEYNADPNKTDKQGNNALHIAAEEGLPEEMINLLVYRGASLKKTNELGYTPAQAAEFNMNNPLASHIKKVDNIFIAINGNHIKQIEQMLKDYPGRLNEKNELGDTPLLHALKQNNKQYAIGFINAGADIKSVDQNGNTALHLAAEKGYVDCIQKILENDSSVINQLNNVGDTPLIRAAACDQKEAIQELIIQGADLNHQGEHNLTALHWATGRNRSDIVDILVAHNADTTLVSNYGTPLQIAQNRNVDEQLITSLQEIQEKIDQENDLFKALDAGNEEAINKLIKTKTNLEKRNSDGDTPLLYCLKNKNLQKYAQKFIAVPVDLNAQDKAGNSALHLAAQNGLANTIKNLLKNPSCDKTITNNLGQTALMLSAQQKNQHAVNHLIKAGMQLDKQDKNGKTALHYAVEKKNEPLVKKLINAGASIDIKTKINKTPLELAQKNSPIAKALQEHKANIELASNIFFAIHNEKTDRIKQLLTQDPNNLEIRWNGDTPLLYSLKNKKPLIALGFIQTTNANLLAADDNSNTALHLAAGNGYESIVQALLEKNIDPNIKNNDGITALHYSVQQEHLEIAKMLVQKNANVNALDNTQSTPLHWAAYFNQPDIITFLALQPGINLNLKNNKALTPFMSAAYFNKPEAALALLKAGVMLDETINTAQFSPEIAQIIIDYKKYNDIFDAIDQKDTNRIQILINTNKSNVEKRHFNDNDTPLLYCIKKNEAKFTGYAKNLIVGEGADITAIDRYGNTPLHCACGTGNITLIKTLLDKNAALDSKNLYNQTPLIIAAINNKTDATNALLAKKPAINEQDNSGNTALHYAAQKNNESMVTALLTNGADVYAKNNQGKMPIDLAEDTTKTILQDHQTQIELNNNIFHAISINNKNRVEELLKDPTVLESKLSGQTPLLYCLNNNKPEIAIMCIHAGADMQTQDSDGNKPIHKACFFGFTTVVKELLKKGTNVDQTNNQKITPLHYAAQQNKLDIAQILINAGASIDAETFTNETPLHFAAKKNHAEMIKLLIDNKASINLQNSNGQTALHLAVAHNAPEATQVLIENNAFQEIKDLNEKTPLDLAQDNSKAKEILIRNDIFTAIDNNDHTLIQTLAKNKHNLNRIKGDTKDTPLLYALRKAKPEIALNLIQYGANTDATDVQKYNALHLASQHNYFDVAQALVTNNKLINAQNTQDGNTPLHFAIMYADMNMASLLLVADALFDIKNSMNKTAFELAKDYNKTEVVQLLESIPTPLTRGFFKIKYRLNNLKKKLQVLGGALSELRTKLVD